MNLNRIASRIAGTAGYLDPKIDVDPETAKNWMKSRPGSDLQHLINELQDPNTDPAKIPQILRHISNSATEALLELKGLPEAAEEAA
jgi:hypothetical protein